MVPMRGIRTETVISAAVPPATPMLRGTNDRYAAFLIGFRCATASTATN